MAREFFRNYPLSESQRSDLRRMFLDPLPPKPPKGKKRNMTQLSEHFSYEELTASDTAVRLGIDNTPPPEIVPHLTVLAHGLEQIRRVTGHAMIMHSGYRCEALERVVTAKDYAAWCIRHGKPQSEGTWREYFETKAHPKGYAGDFICPMFGTPIEIVRAVNASGIKFDELIQEGTWVHASFDTQLRGVVRTAHFAPDGTPTYTTGIA